MIINNHPITTAPVTYDGVWAKSINIVSPSPTAPIRAIVILAPYSIASGSLHPSIVKQHIIHDLRTAATGSLQIADAWENINDYLQTQIVSGAIKF